MLLAACVAKKRLARMEAGWLRIHLPRPSLDPLNGSSELFVTMMPLSHASSLGTLPYDMLLFRSVRFPTPNKAGPRCCRDNRVRQRSIHSPVCSCPRTSPEKRRLTDPRRASHRIEILTTRPARDGLVFLAVFAVQYSRGYCIHYNLLQY